MVSGQSRLLLPHVGQGDAGSDSRQSGCCRPCNSKLQLEQLWWVLPWGADVDRATFQATQASGSQLLQRVSTEEKGRCVLHEEWTKADGALAGACTNLGSGRQQSPERSKRSDQLLEPCKLGTRYGPAIGERPELTRGQPGQVYTEVR